MDEVIEKLKERSEESENNYLDARYWDLIFKDYPRYGTIYIDSESLDNGISLNIETNLRDEGESSDPYIIRIRIEKDHYIHSNLLILDEDKKKLIRFEPSNKDENFDDQIMKILYLLFSNMDLGDYTYDEIFSNKNDSQCIVRCIIHALEYISDEELNSNMHECCNIIEHYYGYLSGEPEIELGKDTVKKGALAGGLAGGLVGSIGGPVGALVGFGVGSLAGAGASYLYGKDDKKSKSSSSKSKSKSSSSKSKSSSNKKRNKLSSSNKKKK